MGSLSSRPKVPAQPQVVYVPSPVYAYTPPTGTDAPTSSETPEQTAAARKASLLQRSRGRLGTIATSFRGLLDLAGSSSGRKTLLGE